MLTSAILVAVIMFLVKTADHTLGQPLIERPLICGALVGLALGDLQQGIIIGATLELIFLGTITIGGSVPADLAVGSVLATAFTILTHGAAGGRCAGAAYQPAGGLCLSGAEAGLYRSG
jgi:PTS system mannose-specific IIC component